MSARADLVDEHVQFNFNEWRKELEAEDVREFGGVIHRTDRDLELMHQMYLKAQCSNEFKSKREKLYK